ncbi:cell adhesion molecule 2b isoform X1 [Tachysurus ichikawai]
MKDTLEDLKDIHPQIESVKSVCYGGVKEVNATGRSFTVKSTIQLQVDQKDDGAAYTCSVEHIALNSTPHHVTEVLEVYCE